MENCSHGLDLQDYCKECDKNAPRSMPNVHVHTITNGKSLDVDVPTGEKCNCCGKPHATRKEYLDFYNLMGGVQAGDIGKHVYWTGRVFQVENDEQFIKRTSK